MEISCDWALSKHNKHSVMTTVILQAFHSIQHKYRHFIEFHTDRTKYNSCVGDAVYSNTFSHARRISANASIFTPEHFEGLTATEYIKEHRILKTIVYVNFLRCKSPKIV